MLVVDAARAVEREVAVGEGGGGGKGGLRRMTLTMVVTPADRWNASASRLPSSLAFAFPVDSTLHRSLAPPPSATFSELRHGRQLLSC